MLRLGWHGKQASTKRALTRVSCRSTIITNTKPVSPAGPWSEEVNVNHNPIRDRLKHPKLRAHHRLSTTGICSTLRPRNDFTVRSRLASWRFNTGPHSRGIPVCSTCFGRRRNDACCPSMGDTRFDSSRNRHKAPELERRRVGKSARSLSIRGGKPLHVLSVLRQYAYRDSLFVPHLAIQRITNLLRTHRVRLGNSCYSMRICSRITRRTSTLLSENRKSSWKP